MARSSRALLALLCAAPAACAPLIGAEFDDAVLREDDDAGAGILAPDDAGRTAPDASSARQPDALAGLSLWLRADDGVETSSVGSVEPGVVRWRDRSPKAHDARQPESLFGPRVVRRARSGLPAIELDGTSRFLELPWPDGLAREATLLIALRGSAAATISFRDEEGTAGLAFGTAPGDDAPALLAYEGEQSALARTGAPTTAWSVLSVRARAKATAGVQLWHDGIASEATSWISDRLPAVSTLCIGRLRGSGDTPDTFADALIGEIVVFSRALPDAELREMGRYLANRWSTPRPP